MMVMMTIANIVDIAKCQSLLQALSPLLQPYKIGIVIPDFPEEETAKRASCISFFINFFDSNLLIKLQILRH